MRKRTSGKALAVLSSFSLMLFPFAASAKQMPGEHFTYWAGALRHTLGEHVAQMLIERARQKAAADAARREAPAATPSPRPGPRPVERPSFERLHERPATRESTGVDERGFRGA
jgi:hypothetical protein